MAYSQIEIYGRYNCAERVGSVITGSYSQACGIDFVRQDKEKILYEAIMFITYISLLIGRNIFVEFKTSIVTGNTYLFISPTETTIWSTLIFDGYGYQNDFKSSILKRLLWYNTINKKQYYILKEKLL